MRPSFKLSNTNIMCAMAVVPMLLAAELLIGEETSKNYSATKVSEMVSETASGIARNATYVTLYAAAAKTMAKEDALEKRPENTLARSRETKTVNYDVENQ